MQKNHLYYLEIHFAYIRSPTCKTGEVDENKQTPNHMKIPDFIIEGRKEKEETQKSGSEQDLSELWNNQQKTQPLLKDLLLQEW